MKTTHEVDRQFPAPSALTNGSIDLAEQVERLQARIGDLEDRYRELLRKGAPSGRSLRPVTAAWFEEPDESSSSDVDGDDRVRCLVFDHCRIFAAGLGSVLDESKEAVVVGWAADRDEALAEVARLRPDVVVASAEPLSVAVSLARRIPDVPVLVMSSSTLHEDIRAALRGGARGFVSKTADIDEVVRALDRVKPPRRGRHARDRTPGPSAFAEPAPRISAPRTDRTGPDGVVLTQRERDIVDLIAAGLSNKQVARHLGLAQQTVKNHVSNILRKLDVPSRVHVSLWASATSRRAVTDEATSSLRRSTSA